MFAQHKFGILFVLCAFNVAYIHAGVGSPCFDPEDCGGWGSHFDCIGGSCQCDKDHIPDRNNQWCVVGLLQPCDYSDKCYDINSQCKGYLTTQKGTCECNEGFTIDRLNMVCSIIIGNNCTADAEKCIEGSCINNKCTCNNPLEPNINGTKCLPKVHDDCSSYKECAQENAICDAQMKCTCVENYKNASRNNTIYCLAMLGNKCKNATDCADIGADCVPINETTKYNRWHEPEPEIQKTCVCGPGYVQHPTYSECLKIASQLHDNCTENVQCSAYSGFGSECVANKCECKNGFYFDVDFNRCVRSCLCNDVTKDITNIKSLMKDLKPFIEQMARDNNVDATRLLRKIHKL